MMENDALKKAFRALIAEIAANAGNYPETIPVIEARLSTIVGADLAENYCRSMGDAARAFTEMEAHVKRLTS